MQILNRIISERSVGGGLAPRRLRLAAIVLTGLSAASLCLGLMQRQTQSRRFDRAAIAHAELYHDLELEAAAPPESNTVNGVAETLTRGVAAGATRDAGTVNSAAYEIPSASTLRGAWLTGTIIADDFDNQ